MQRGLAVRKVKLETTFNLLREANACESGYKELGWNLRAKHR